MSDERQASCGGQTLYIILGLAAAIAITWEQNCSTTVKVIAIILALIGCVPLGIIGYKIGSLIANTICPDAIFTNVENTGRAYIYMILCHFLPKFFCCVILIALPSGILTSLFERDEYSYSQESNTTYQTTKNVSDGQSFLEMLEDDINNNQLTPLVYNDNVFLTKDSKWVFYLYIPNSKHNQATVYTETSQLDASWHKLNEMNSRVLLSEKDYTIWQKGISDFYVKTPKGNFFSVSTKVRDTAKAKRP